MKKKRFKELLTKTGRKGMDEVLSNLEKLGFFEAPASTRFHLNREGGLLEHSLNVYDSAVALRTKVIRVRPELEHQLPLDSVAIASLLHDACKADIYVPAIVSQKNAAGDLEKVTGYQVDYSGMPLGHGEKSVIMLLKCGLEMTDDEIMAIRWHMTAWDLAFQSPEQKESLRVAREKTPLCSLVQCADSISTGLLER